MHRRPRLTLALLIAALLTASLVLLHTAASWSFRADPHPPRDLRAELNAPWAGIPDHERAAPVYQALHDAWHAMPPLPQSNHNLSTISPSDPAFPGLAGIVASFEPHLDKARRASRLPVLGADFLPAEPGADPAPFAPYDAVMAESLYYLRTPAMSAAATTARLLLIDAEAAAIDRDGPRAAENIHAALAITRQLRELPLFIADYIAITTVSGTADRIRRILVEHPDTWPPDTLAALQTDLTETAAQTALRFDTDRLAFTDLLDRSFTPGPGGRITAVGMRRCDTLGSNAMMRARIPDEHARIAPLKSWTIGTRAEHLEAFESHLTAAIEAQRTGFRGLNALHAAENELIFNNKTIERRLPLLRMTTPAYASAVHNEHTMRLEVAATAIALALHQHHAHHGSFPDTLDALVPAYLTAIPTDPFDLDGGPIKYLRPSHAHAFTLYSNGSNFKDDLATPFIPDPNASPGIIRRYATDAAGNPIPDHTHNADWILLLPPPPPPPN